MKGPLICATALSLAACWLTGEGPTAIVWCDTTVHTRLVEHSPTHWSLVTDSVTYAPPGCVPPFDGAAR